MTTIMKSINSNETKFDWQEEIKKDENYNEDENGLTLIMARTGTGKTKAQFDIAIHFKRLGKRSVTLYVPNDCKFLIEQTKDKFIEYCKKDRIEYKLTKDGINLGNFKCFITSFIANTESPMKLLKIHDDMNPVIFDEFDHIGTQLGLIHGGTTSNFSKTSLPTHKKNWEKTKFNFLERLCNRTAVYGFSATLDEIISKDLRPYENKFNIKIFIVNHKKDVLNNVKILYRPKEKLKEKIVNFYKRKKKTIVFVNNIFEMNIICDYLRDHGVPFYKWNSQSNMKFNYKKIESNVISVFVNGGARGLDIKDIERIVLFRPLKASTKEDKTLLSGLANQIMGRIRENGIIYREDNITNKSSNLFDLVEEIYNEVLSDKFNYHREFWRKIIKFHIYNNDYQNNIVRLYINTWIQKEIHFDAKRGVSITQRLKNTFIDDVMYNVLISDIRNHLKLKTLDDKFIDQYVELEQKIMNQYKIAFGEINNIIIDEEEMFITNSFDNNYNSTGGGKAKPNISNEEKEKGYKCLIQAIKNCRLKGDSLIISDDYSDNIYQGEYMHAKEKSILSNSERIKSKYAVPMVDTLESGINQNDKNTELFNYDEIHGITINYDKLRELIGKKIICCRTKKEIDGILREYNKLHK